MNALVKWGLVLIVLFSLLLNVVLIVVHSRKTPQCMTKKMHALQGKHDERSGVFADLSWDEYVQVQNYMLRQKDLDISTRQVTRPDQNFLFFIDLRVPCKLEVLRYLDAGGSIQAAKRGHCGGLLRRQGLHQRVRCGAAA